MPLANCTKYVGRGIPDAPFTNANIIVSGASGMQTAQKLQCRWQIAQSL